MLGRAVAGCRVAVGDPAFKPVEGRGVDTRGVVASLREPGVHCAQQIGCQIRVLGLQHAVGILRVVDPIEAEDGGGCQAAVVVG